MANAGKRSDWFDTHGDLNTSDKLGGSHRLIVSRKLGQSQALNLRYSRLQMRSRKNDNCFTYTVMLYTNVMASTIKLSLRFVLWTRICVCVVTIRTRIVALLDEFSGENDQLLAQSCANAVWDVI